MRRGGIGGDSREDEVVAGRLTPMARTMNRRGLLKVIATMSAGSALGANTVSAYDAVKGAGVTPLRDGSRVSNRIAAPARGSLQIGVLLPRSGYLAPSGDACFAGAALARTLLPQLGYPTVALLEADTGEGVDSAVHATQALLEGGRVHLLIGCFDSGQTVEVAALAEQHRVPLIINIAAAPAITQQGYRFVFRNFPDAVRIVSDSYRLQKELFAATGFTPRRLVLMHINNGRGIELIDELYPSMTMPYEKVGAIAYDPREEDLSTQVAAAKATGADALWTVSRMGDAIRITRELVRQSWTPGILMSSNADLHEAPYLQALGPYADYAVTFAPFYDPNKPLSRRLQALQDQLSPRVPLGTEQVYTFEAVLIAADAYKRAGSTQAGALAEALRSTSLRDSVTGPRVSFDEHGQNTALGLTAIQNLQGSGRIVLPTAAAQARPVLPMPQWDERRN